jgi:hypothetical protein
MSHPQLNGLQYFTFDSTDIIIVGRNRNGDAYTTLYYPRVIHLSQITMDA